MVEELAAEEAAADCPLASPTWGAEGTLVVITGVIRFRLCCGSLLGVLETRFDWACGERVSLDGHNTTTAAAAASTHRCRSGDAIVVDELESVVF